MEKNVNQNPKAEWIPCESCFNNMRVKEAGDGVENAFNFCVLTDKVDCKIVVECNKWKER